MKKILIICCVVCCMFISACGNPSTTKAYESYVCDMANDGIISEFEKTWWTGLPIIDENIQAVKNFSFASESYAGEYDSSLFAKNSPVRFDRYYDKEKGVSLKFESQTGKFMGIHFDSLLKNDYIAMTDKDNSHEFALETATRLASEYIDTEKYTLEEEESVVYATDNDSNKVILYTFRFVKYIDGFATSEQVYVNVTSKGDLFTLTVSNIGLFDNAGDIKIDRKALDESLNSKIKALYGDRYTYLYDIYKQTLTYSPDGELTVVSAIDLELRSDVTLVSGVMLATVID